MWAIAWDASTSPHAATILAQFTADQPNWDQPTETAPVPHERDRRAPRPIGYWPFAATAFVAAGDPAADETAATSLQDDLNAAGEAWPWNTGSAGQLVLALAGRGARRLLVGWSVRALRLGHRRIACKNTGLLTRSARGSGRSGRGSSPRP